MTPQTLLDATNPASVANDLQNVVILQNDNQDNALSTILTAEEIEASKNIQAVFYRAKIQVPNDYEKISETGMVTPIYDNADPAFKEYDMVRVRVYNPGNGLTDESHQYVNDYHIRRWPDRWRAYKEGRANQMDGTDIDVLTTIPEQLKLKLKEQGIFTVEKLAGLNKPETVIPNGAKYQEIAKQYVARTNFGKTQDLESEVKELKEQLAQLLKAQKK